MCSAFAGNIRHTHIILHTRTLMFSTLNVYIITRLHNNYQYNIYLYYNIDVTTTEKICLANKDFNSYKPKELIKTLKVVILIN